MLSTRLARVPTFATLARRAYSEHPGSVAQSQGFNKKEKAHEDQYARERERAELKKIREQIDKKKEEIDRLEKAAEEIKSDEKK